MSASDALERQRALNRETSPSWQAFAAHRQQLTRLLSGRATGLRLCVLGAGNANDLDIEQLRSRFSEITLVDLDAEALARAIARQSADAQRVLRISPPLDLCRLQSLLDEPPERGPVAMAEPLAAALGAGTYDLVVSTCLLTQLIDQVRERLEADGPRCLQVIQRLRRAHVALMLALLRSGGRGVLVSDLVSSDTAPELLSATERLPELMVKLVSAQNFFTGTNPFVLETELRKDASLAPLVARVALHPPWIWHLNAARAYLAFGLSFQRA